jgi:hypothetical protein
MERTFQVGMTEDIGNADPVQPLRLGMETPSLEREGTRIYSKTMEEAAVILALLRILAQVAGN